MLDRGRRQSEVSLHGMETGIMTRARPEYVKCAKKERWETVCGRRPDAFEWLFENMEHALANEANGGYLMLCNDCRKASEGKKKIEVQCFNCNRAMTVSKADAQEYGDKKWLCAGCALGDEGDNL